MVSEAANAIASKTVDWFIVALVIVFTVSSLSMSAMKLWNMVASEYYAVRDKLRKEKAKYEAKVEELKSQSVE